MKALIDTNVIVDVLQNRLPWSEEGRKIFYAAAMDRFEGCITSKQSADLYYFSRKQFSGTESAEAKARQVLGRLFELFHIVDTRGIDCIQALAFDNSDYEDALLITNAQRENPDCIVTRNAGHFKSSPVPVYSPDEFLKLPAFQY